MAILRVRISRSKFDEISSDTRTDITVYVRSKTQRTPHVLIQLPGEKFQEDLKYDIDVEMELVRPGRGDEAMGE